VDSEAARNDIVEIGRRLYARGLIGGNEGNVSVREADVIYITPAGVCKGFLKPEMIVKTDLAGRPTDGGRASTETLMHTVIYRRRPDVRAVVHAHPPTATGFAVAQVALDRPLIAEAVVALGPVPLIPYGRPSTSELADQVGQAICDAHALLLANHGALAVGEDVYRAWERMETLEQLAKVALVSRQLGHGQELPAPAVERLREMRTAAGYPPPACGVAAAAPAPSVEGDRVVLTRAELTRLLAEAVARFSRT
jgi:L-fuculose-phosphate aldolase